MEGDNAALIAAGAQLASTSVNAISAANTNKKQREWQEEMYARQRADNLAQWQLQNKYNSPSEQMKRYQEAGLNPNLIYGSGSASAGNASSIATPSPGSWNPKTPEVNLGSAMSAYQDTRMRQLQNDNLLAQNTVLTEEALLKQASRNSLNVRTALDSMTMAKRPELLQISVDAAKMGLEKLTAETGFSQQRTAFQTQFLEADLQTKMATLDNIKANANRTNASTKEVEAATALKNLEIDLQKQGVTHSDPFYFRAIARLLQYFGVPLFQDHKLNK